MSTHLVGYFRVSSKTQEQNSSLSAQRQKLIAAGVKEENLHFDVKSGKSFLRPGLRAALDQLQPNSVLVITKMDRVSRKLRDFFLLQAELERRGATLRCLEDDVAQTTPGGKLSFAVLAAASEFELEIRAARIKSGMEARKSQGFVSVGRPPLLTLELKKQFYQLIKNNVLSSAALSAQLPISQKTLENYLQQGYLSKKGRSFETKQIKDFPYFQRKKRNEALKRKTQQKLLR